jgi:hypothetical protein
VVNQTKTTIGSTGCSNGAGDLRLDRPSECGESVDPQGLTLW